MNFCGNIDAAGLYACIPELFLTQIRAAGAGIGFGAVAHVHDACLDINIFWLWRPPGPRSRLT
jgi:hypothetical protein